MVKVKFVQYPPIINGTYMKDTPNSQVGFQKFEIEKTYIDRNITASDHWPLWMEMNTENKN